jgi:hypothetical protein
LSPRKPCASSICAASGTLLDVGGGTGAFLTAAGLVTPDLRLHLFDLPVVAEGATARFAVTALTDRATITGGNFRTDAIPGGADAISLVRVLYDHSDDTVRMLLAKAHAALAVWRTPDRGGTDVGRNPSDAQHRRLFRGLLHGHANRPRPERRRDRQPSDRGRIFGRAAGQDGTAVHHRCRHRAEGLKKDIEQCPFLLTCQSVRLN